MGATDATSPHLVQPPAWRAFVHLYAPFLTSALLVLFVPNPLQSVLFIAICAIPTYLIGSFVYPTNRPAPPPDQLIRFTRRSALYRICVLFTYGRLYGTPFKLGFFIADVLLNYAAGAVIGERTAGAPQRTSEFLVHALWTVMSGLLLAFVIPSSGMLFTLAVTVDRTLWRAMYLALVDDLVGILMYPNLQTKKGKAMVMLVQAVLITAVVLLVRIRMHTNIPKQGEGAEQGVESTG